MHKIYFGAMRYTSKSVPYWLSSSYSKEIQLVISVNKPNVNQPIRL